MIETQWLKTPNSLFELLCYITLLQRMRVIFHAFPFRSNTPFCSWRSLTFSCNLSLGWHFEVWFFLWKVTLVTNIPLSVFNSSVWQLTCDYVVFKCVCVWLCGGRHVIVKLACVFYSVAFCIVKEPAAAIRAVYFWLMAQSHGTKDFITIGHTITNTHSWIHAG